MFGFSLDDCYAQEKLETMVMQNLEGGGGGKQLRCIMIYVKMLNALLEHLLRITLSYFFIFPFFVLSTNIYNTRVQPLLICFSLKNANAYECMEKGRR